MSDTDEQLRMESRRENERRIARTLRVCEAVMKEGLDPAIGVRNIEEIVSGDGDRIVKVGSIHTPQIKTGRPI